MDNRFFGNYLVNDLENETVLHEINAKMELLISEVLRCFSYFNARFKV